MTFILVVFVYAGMMAKGDSVALTNVPGFKTEAECVAAGNKVAALPSGTKNIEFACVAQTK